MKTLLSIVAAAALTACASAPPPIELSEQWPAEAQSYSAATRAWTRSGELVRDFDKLLGVRATFKSPAWRAAWVAHRAKRDGLPDAERATLLAEQKKAAAEYHEVELIAATYDGRENDFQRGDRSIWRIALIDDQGRQVTPVSIKRDRRPDSILKAEFPGIDDFAEAYVVKFPRDADVLRDGASQFTLRISSVRGAVELVWKAR